MIKKKSMKNEKMMSNPYLYYVTNWGFVGANQTKPTRGVNGKS